MTRTNKFHLTVDAAEAYESQKVPAIFAPIARATLDAISLPRRADVLDVACGTGAVTREVALRLAEPSRIVGADFNPAMIEIARRMFPASSHDVEFVVAPAEDMPFDDASFDIVFCQQGLQFFPDRSSALAEMRRVLKPRGDLYLTCWAGTPPFFQFVSDVLGRRIDQNAAARAVAPFIWSDGNHISSLIADAGFDCGLPTQIQVNRTMSANRTAIQAELLATPNEAALRQAGDEVFQDIVSEILEGVAQYRDGDRLVMPQAAHLFRATAV